MDASANIGKASGKAGTGGGKVGAKKAQSTKQREENDLVSQDASDRIQKRLAFIAGLLHPDCMGTQGSASATSRKSAAPSSSSGDMTKKRGRMAEKEEDALMIKQVETSSTKTMQCLVAQPSLLKNGVLRDYQLSGVKWLVHLYENGISGILAGTQPPHPHGVHVHLYMCACLHACLQMCARVCVRVHA